MQHGTGRELVAEAIENALEHLAREHSYHGRPNADVRNALEYALEAVELGKDIDVRGVYGPDYPGQHPQDPGPKRGEPGFGDYIPPIMRESHPKVVKYLGPTGSIRDTRPKDLGR